MQSLYYVTAKLKALQYCNTMKVKNAKSAKESNECKECKERNVQRNRYSNMFSNKIVCVFVFTFADVCLDCATQTQTKSFVVVILFEFQNFDDIRTHTQMMCVVAIVLNFFLCDDTLNAMYKWYVCSYFKMCEVI